MSQTNTSIVEHVSEGENIVITVLETHLRDQERVQRIREALIEAIGSGPFKNAIIDMVRVQFIGSIGFLAFLAVRRVPGIQNVVLCNLSDNLKELFTICKLIPTAGASSAPFMVADSVESALTKLNES